MAAKLRRVGGDAQGGIAKGFKCLTIRGRSRASGGDE
jgi:hypothetical protein